MSLRSSNILSTAHCIPSKSNTRFPVTFTVTCYHPHIRMRHLLSATQQICHPCQLLIFLPSLIFVIIIFNYHQSSLLLLVTLIISYIYVTVTTNYNVSRCHHFLPFYLSPSSRYLLPPLPSVILPCHYQHMHIMSLLSSTTFYHWCR